MKVIVLAAGRSIRMKPIEDKNFLDFLGKPLLQHQLEQLQRLGLRDIVLVTRDRRLLGTKLTPTVAKKIDIVEQLDLEGMAGAVLAAEKSIKKGEAMLVVNANDLLDDSAFRSILRAIKAELEMDGFLLAKKVERYFPGGYLKVRKNGLIERIVEKPAPGKEPSALVNIVVHYHRDAGKFFDALHRTKSVRDDRYEAALDMLFQQGARYKTVRYEGFWQPLKYPWHVLDVMEHFLESLPEFKTPKRSATGHIEIAPSAVIRGKVWLSEGVRVLDHAVIVGPAFIGRDSIIATNALVRGSHIGANCVIGFGSEIARSYLGHDVWTHTNYIGDSIIGNDVSFGSGCVTGNLRLDEGIIPVKINGGKIDSGRTKFGLMTGDHVRCGINTSFMPGVKIGHGSFIGAGLTLAEDVGDGKYVYGRTELVIKENKARPVSGTREKMKGKI